MNQVDNFSNDDGEVDQSVYEGPQTRSCTRKLMKANCLMADLFDVETGEICDDVLDVIVVISEVNDKSIRDLVLEFWYKQIFTFYCVCCDLAKAGAHSFVANQDFWLIAFLVGELEIVQTVSILELNQEPSKIHWDESVLVREAISRNFWFVLISCY